jgi:hypothetical protein
MHFQENAIDSGSHRRSREDRDKFRLTAADRWAMVVGLR